MEKSAIRKVDAEILIHIQEVGVKSKVRRNGVMCVEQKLTTISNVGRKQMKTHKSCEDKSHTFASTISSSPECVDIVDSFLVDTGATAHIVNDKNLFSSSFEREKHSIVFADGSRVNGLAPGKGKAKLQLRDSTGHVRDTVIENALYVPSFQQNIFSEQSATKYGSSVEFKEDKGLPKCKGGI